MMLTLRCKKCGALVPEEETVIDDEAGIVRRHRVCLGVVESAKRVEDRNEAVNHPKHYNALDARCHGCGREIECIDVVEKMNFNVGNAVKYLWRADHKGNPIQDIEKSIWYLQREVQRRKAEQQK